MLRPFLPLIVLSLVAGVATGCGGGSTITPCSNCVTPTPPTKASSVTLTGSPATTTPDAFITLKASVTPGDATGSVVFTDNTTVGDLDREILYGPVSATVRGLQPGTHVITASYAGDSTYMASASAPFTLSILDAGANCGLGTSAYVLGSGSATFSGQSYTSTTTNQSAVCATGPGTSLTLNTPTIVGAGTPSYDDPAGIGAAVLAYSAPGSASGPVIAVNGGTILTTFSGAQNVMASGPGAAVSVANATLTSTNPGTTDNHGAYLAHNHLGQASRGGALHFTNVNATSGDYSGAGIFAQGDGSAVDITGGTWTTNGAAAWLEGQSMLTLQDTVLTSAYGVRFLNRSLMDGSATGMPNFRMTGGSFSNVGGNLQADYFYLYDSSASITLTNTTLNFIAGVGSPDPQLVNVNSVPGKTPVTATIAASNSSLVGVAQVDSLSALNLSLSNKSVWKGSFSPYLTSSSSLTLDAGSTWDVQYCTVCVVQVFNDAAGISGATITNVIGNGKTVTYDKTKNPGLGGKTYSLQKGGQLVPSN